MIARQQFKDSATGEIAHSLVLVVHCYSQGGYRRSGRRADCFEGQGRLAPDLCLPVPQGPDELGYGGERLRPGRAKPHGRFRADPRARITESTGQRRHGEVGP